MLKFFTTILNFIKSVFGLVFLVLDHIIHFIVSIPTYLNFVLNLFDLMPVFIKPFIIVGALYLVTDLIYKKVRGVQ